MHASADESDFLLYRLCLSVLVITGSFREHVFKKNKTMQIWIPPKLKWGPSCLEGDIGVGLVRGCGVFSSMFNSSFPTISYSGVVLTSDLFTTSVNGRNRYGLEWHSVERIPPPRPNRPLQFNQAAKEIDIGPPEICPVCSIKILDFFSGKYVENVKKKPKKKPLQCLKIVMKKLLDPPIVPLNTIKLRQIARTYRY